MPAPMNSKATYSGASLAACRATHGGQVSGKVSDKDRHTDPSGLGADEGLLSTVSTPQQRTSHCPKIGQSATEKKKVEDQTIYVE